MAIATINTHHLVMAVLLLLESGARRDVDGDGAHMDGPFFMVTRWDLRLQCAQTVLTLRSRDIVRAEVQKDGVTTGYVLGAGWAGGSA
jgi:hypothetical protein